MGMIFDDEPLMKAKQIGNFVINKSPPQPLKNGLAISKNDSDVNQGLTLNQDPEDELSLLIKSKEK